MFLDCCRQKMVGLFQMLYQIHQTQLINHQVKPVEATDMLDTAYE